MRTTIGLRRARALCACGLAALAAAPAAEAQTADIRPGKHISVFGGSALVGAFGYPVDTPMRFELLRDGHLVAAVNAPSTATVDGIGMQLNHEPLGVALPGNCWTTHTPRILAGDVIRVTGDGGTDTVVVDDIRMTAGPYIDPADNVVVEGVARYAGGAPIPLAALDSAELQAEDPRVRAVPTRIERVEGSDDGWRATYERVPAGGGPAYGVFRNDDGIGLDAQRDRVLAGVHTVGYGHLDPPPPVMQLAETGVTPGPAPGCEAAPLVPENAITALDDEIVNVASGDLVVGGVSTPGTNVSVVLDDGDPDTSPVVVDAAEGASGAWSATVSRAQLESLADGTLNVSSSLGANALSVAKDVRGPGAIAATPAPGTYATGQSVMLGTGDATDVIRYTRNGLDPGPRSARATGAMSVPVTQTIKAFATDTAGNISPVYELRYTIAGTTPVQPGAGQGGCGCGPITALAPLADVATAPAPLAAATATVPVPTKAKPFLRSLQTNRRVRRSSASRSGIRLVMRVGADARVVRIRVFRKLGNGKRALISTSLRSPSRAGLFRVRLADRSLRRKLRIGSYEVDATPGASRTDLGTPSKAGFKVIRG